MIFNLRVELVSYDVAYALALEADLKEGSVEEVADWIVSRTKTECRQIARQRVLRNGESDYWPEVPGDLLLVARHHVDRLWPKGV